ncbi:hypothetical protein DM02DRAFT_677122 [Periconia macrospinosa]|uniref:DUF7708 domain-containing protein n=1 Tax=Periconia macrospinosa TaxID=97972 RepID=A0A2V1D4U6_9PLEO|nr:hypothetical protein DM02DRAFT_677122 [Periconia macrospinosa]
MDSAQIEGWYSNTATSSRSSEILETTFIHAKLLLRSIISPADFTSLFPEFHNVQKTANKDHTILSVQRSLQDAQNSYDRRVGQQHDAFQGMSPTTAVAIPPNPAGPGKAKVKTKRWLTGLSDKILFYGNVFDVMVQHHPEYVALA